MITPQGKPFEDDTDLTAAEVTLKTKITEEHPRKALFQAALSGDSSALYSAGIMFVKGEGVTKNGNVGRSLLKSAQAHGNVLAREWLQRSTASAGGGIPSAVHQDRHQELRETVERAIQSILCGESKEPIIVATGGCYSKVVMPLMRKYGGARIGGSSEVLDDQGRECIVDTYHLREKQVMTGYLLHGHEPKMGLQAPGPALG